MVSKVQMTNAPISGKGCPSPITLPTPPSTRVRTGRFDEEGQDSSGSPHPETLTVNGAVVDAGVALVRLDPIDGP
jgi:hypothetical protein